MKSVIAVLTYAAFLLSAGASSAAETPRKQETVSFKGKITPIFKKYCLPCHAGDSNNPSELFLDSYEDTMKGGEHGSPVVPGKPGESLLIQKLDQNPPFGDPMPMSPTRKKSQTSPKRLTEEEVQVLKRWIEQGAKNN
jgi:hypothetical protein